MKPTSAALLLAIAVLGKWDSQDSSAITSVTSSMSPLLSTPRHAGTGELVPDSPTSSTATSHKQAPSPNYPIPDTTRTGAATPIGTGAVSLTSALDLLEGARQRWPGQYGNATDEQIAQKEKEFGGELHLDKEGNRVPISFGMEALLTLFDEAPDGMFIWPHLPDKGNPITDSPHDFKDTECTGLAVDPFEERRASRHLEYMCNRFQLPNNSLYASTSGKTTIYMCPYKDLRNCSLPLWRAASEHLDRQCGRGRSGYVHLRKLRIGRAPVDGDRVIICEGLHYAPLDEYRISQRPALADGMPYEEWRILNRRKQMREELVPKDINEGNDGNP
ncbi:hypothetical protein LEL_04155 [Akanthomyces lecanii RCEF 1005]|uniref:Uncharacterized protein n=1 Tax=Akanthomyces lecanii RCEF 1005 TaxID=1081108 RepID=A0A162K3B5_CORDF|nr:hypothetical protein LEL_04155 [Akanthomyces lecanii RCEF 1005]